MSVRAHRIVKIEYAPEASFNLWHDDMLVDFIDSHNDGGLCSQLDMDGGGVVNIELSVIKDAIEKAAELELDEETIAQLKADVKGAEAAEEDFLEYNCF